MQLKEYSVSLPPTFVVGDVAPIADREDVVLSVRKCASRKGLLQLNLRNKGGREYTAAFLVPESLQEQIIFSILRKENMTLHEVEELPIVESVSADSQSSSPQASPAKQPRTMRLYGALRPLFARASAIISILLFPVE